MIFFYINHFSLIIFYHSVWLGFELLSHLVQVHSLRCSFTFARKGYDNRHCQNKAQTGNEAGAWMTSCPEEMVLRIQLKVDIGPWRKIVESSAIGGRELNFQPLRRRLSFPDIYRQKWMEILNITRCAERWGWGQHSMISIVRIVSLSSCRRTDVNKTVRTWTTEFTCVFVFVCIWICTCVFYCVFEYEFVSRLYNKSYYLMPYYSSGDMCRLLAERYDTKSKVKLGGFQPELKASCVSSHTDELWYNETVCLYGWLYIYIM